MKIGVMDSGIGGITTLAALMKSCGGEYIYVKDALGPYGDKSDSFVIGRTFKACSKLKSLGVKIIVLACNTATNVAIHRLRAADKSVIYIGMEPAVKPALKECDKVAVALTPVAARQSKFLALIESGGDRIKLITDATLAPAIENSGFDTERLKDLSLTLLDGCQDCEGLVLGCTHYVFLRQNLEFLAPHMRIYDGNEGVAKRVLGITGRSETASVRFLKID